MAPGVKGWVPEERGGLFGIEENKRITYHMGPTGAKPILVLRNFSELLSHYISQHIKIVNRLRNNIFSQLASQ